MQIKHRKSPYIIAVLAATLSGFAPNGAAGDDKSAPVYTASTRLGAAPDLGSTPEIRIGEREIRLDGTVRLVHAAQNSFILEVNSYTLPNGRSQLLPSPRAKLILVSSRTLLNITGGVLPGGALPGGVLPGGDLSELKQGMRVAAVGSDWGRGKELPAHSITVLDTPSINNTPSTNNALPINTGSTTNAKLSSESASFETGGNTAIESTAPISATPGDSTIDKRLQPRAPGKADQWRLWNKAFERSQMLRAAQNKVGFSYFSGGSSRQKIVALPLTMAPTPAAPQKSSTS